MELPVDLQHFVQASFAPEDWPKALLLLASARIETGEPASARMLRCAAVASQGDLARLQRYVSLLAVDWRDVILAGEYELHDKVTVQVRDLSRPL